MGDLVRFLRKNRGIDLGWYIIALWRSKISHLVIGKNYAQYKKKSKEF